MRAIGYCDISIKKEPVLTPDTFKVLFESYCNSWGHTSEEIFVSGSHTEDSNDTLQQVKNFINADNGAFLLVVPDARHIGNDLESIARVVVSIDKLQSSVICMDEEYPDILQNAFLYFSAPGVSINKSHNIKAGMQARAISGVALGKVPFGYQVSDEGLLVPNPKEVTLVNQIFEMYVNKDMGLRKISQQLNDDGVLTRRGKNWNIVSLRDMLRNSVYIGTYVRFGLRLLRNHPPIIAPELFRQAQDKVRERRSYRSFPKSRPYLLAGLLKCAYCGDSMIGSTRRQTWVKQSGDRVSNEYRYYQCQSKSNRGTCEYHTWQTEKLESLVVETIKSHVESNLLQESMSGEKGEEKQREAAVRRLKHVASYEKRFLDFMKKTSQGQSVIERLALYLDELDESRRGAFISIPPEKCQTFINNWDEKDFVEQHSFLNEYIYKIDVRKRSVKLRF